MEDEKYITKNSQSEVSRLRKNIKMGNKPNIIIDGDEVSFIYKCFKYLSFTFSELLP